MTYGGGGGTLACERSLYRNTMNTWGNNDPTRMSEDEPADEIHERKAFPTPTL